MRQKRQVMLSVSLSLSCANDPLLAVARVREDETPKSSPSGRADASLCLPHPPSLTSREPEKREREIATLYILLSGIDRLLACAGQLKEPVGDRRRNVEIVLLSSIFQPVWGGYRETRRSSHEGCLSRKRQISLERLSSYGAMWR